MQSLQVLIDHLEKGRNIHISILDFNGILSSPLTKIRFEHVIHSKEFCYVAKSTAQGYRTCLRCKASANAKAIKEKVSFCGHCIYGIYEAAVPVIIERSIMAIVYVGNAIIDEVFTKNRIERVCRYTGVSQKKLLLQLDNCERITSSTELFEIGEIVSDYLKMLFESMPILSTEEHWIVSLMKHYAQEHTYGATSLQEFAVSHKKNAQYIGRLFKKEIGMTFSQYCNKVRLKKAATRLSQGNEKIIDIAFTCGFQNVSYFNRLFQEKYGMSPSEYRKELR